MRLLRRIVRIIFSSVFLAVVTVVGAPVALVATVLAGLIFLPLPATIPIPASTARLAEPTTVYDRYGNVIATFQQYDQNIPVTEAQVPQVLEEAVISDEDRNFYHHGGVDLRGTLRALLADVRNQGAVQGGSTITQQYVKLAYVGTQRNLLRKVREAILASQLDRQASKSEILYRYLTLVYFGDGNYGVGAAAEDYFHVPVERLDASQAATLAGLIPAPSTRAPTADIALAEQYRRLVLAKMAQQGYLTGPQYAAALARHLVAAPAAGVAGVARAVGAPVVPAAGVAGVARVARAVGAPVVPAVGVAGVARAVGAPVVPAVGVAGAVGAARGTSPPGAVGAVGTVGAVGAARATVVYSPAPPPSRYPAFVDYVYRWLLSHGYTKQAIYSGGLRIQTTLDPALEDQAIAAVGSTLAGTAPQVDMALASVQPQTGFVEALVGGRYYAQTGPRSVAGFSPPYQDDLAISACDDIPLVSGAQKAAANPPAACWDGNSVDNAGSPGHQPGSSWKPFVLATAFEQGILPTARYAAPYVLQIPGCKVLAGQPPASCQVHNDADGEGGGSLTLAAAMAASVNTVYAQLAPQVGCAQVASTAKALGIDSAYFSTGKFPYCQTYALGEQDVAPLDMASAYGVFDDHGQRAAPTPVLEIVNAVGKVLLDNISRSPATTRVLPANVADNVTNVLQGVLAPGGTAYGHGLGRPAAGKTGTTNNESNAWFTGYTPTLSTSVWMGRDDDPNIGLGVVKGVGQVFGGTWPAATWQAYMSGALTNVPATPFDAPAPIVPPTVAKALAARAAAPRPKVQPGAAADPSGTPTGGPYVVAPATPVAPAPVTTTTTLVFGAPTTSTSPATTTGPATVQGQRTSSPLARAGATPG